MTLNRSFAHGLLATLEFSRRYPAVNQSNDRIMLTLQWTFLRRNSATASQDSATGVSRFQWDHSASQRVRSADSDVFFTRDRASETAQGELHYRDYLFSADAAGSSVQDRRPGAKASGGASFDFGTALAFADGRAALSRPIADSFVIVAPHPSLAGQDIEVNVGNGIPAAKTGPLGPAVLPEVLSYQTQRVDVSAPNLPPWIALGPQPRYVYPGYRSGTVLVAGTAADVILEGLLIDGAGRPLTLEPGVIDNVDDPAAPPQDFFTAKTGRFSIQGLKPGRLLLVLSNYPDMSILLTIPPEGAGIIDAGTLRLLRSR